MKIYNPREKIMELEKQIKQAEENKDPITAAKLSMKVIELKQEFYQ